MNNSKSKTVSARVYVWRQYVCTYVCMHLSVICAPTFAGWQAVYRLLCSLHRKCNLDMRDAFVKRRVNAPRCTRAPFIFYCFFSVCLPKSAVASHRMKLIFSILFICLPVVYYLKVVVGSKQI